jgi:hypothetical protein
VTSNVRKYIFLTATIAVAFVANAAAPQGWLLAGSKPADYDTGIDREAVYKALPSAYLKATADPDGFGTLMQSFSADPYVGKRVRFSAYVKSDGVARWAGLWMRVDGKNPQQPLAFDNMQDRPIKGSAAWKRYEVVLDVPQGATDIALGILLAGAGQVWINSVAVEVVGADVAATGHLAKLPDGPRNLGFDQ